MDRPLSSTSIDVRTAVGLRVGENEPAGWLRGLALVRIGSVTEPDIITDSCGLRIFIIEGLVTIVISVAARFIIADWPDDARFLSSEEKTRLLKRLEGDAHRGVAKMDRFDRPALKRIVLDWKVWVG